jgi:membrane protein DedA with SNARE-associated domain
VLEQLTDLALSFGFPILILALISSGLGLPIPENIPLLLIGFLCEQRDLEVWIWAVLCLGIILTRDALIFALGRNTPRMLAQARWFNRIFTAQRQEQVREHFERSGFQTVFAGRFTPGLRVVVFFMAGRGGVSARTFLLADGLAALLSVPILVVLGYLFSNQLETLKRNVDVVQAVVGIAAISYFALLIYRRWKRTRS